MLSLEFETVKSDFIKYLEEDLPKNYGQKQMFHEIWEERPHVSQLTGKPLIYPQCDRWHWQFLHVLSKGTYTKMKFFKPNIILALPEEHLRQHEYTSFKEATDVLKSVYYDVLSLNRF